ncbi:MAG: PAS domain S-box protein [Desulfobulbaceae bacterium]|nr:PAS domain S-box protein [Desulfobulbaceae bacterium]
MENSVKKMLRFSLVKKFSLILLLALLLFGFTIGEIISSAMRRNMTTRCNEITAHMVHHELHNHLRLNGRNSAKTQGNFAAFAYLTGDLDLGPNVHIRTMKLWDRGGQVVWSTGAEAEEKLNPASSRLANAFNGRITTEISNSYTLAEKLGITVSSSPVIELFVPVRHGSGDEIKGVFQVNATVDRLMEDIAYHNRVVWLSVLTGTLLLYLALYWLFRGAARQIKQQNRRLQDSEERYRNLIYSAEEGIVAADKTGRVLLMNRAAEEMFGYDADEADGLFFPDLFVFDHCEPFRTQLQNFMSNGECCSIGNTFELAGRRKNGEVFPVEVSFSPSGQGGQLILTGLIRDVTRQKELVEELAGAKEHWEEIFNTISDAITIHDKDFNIIQANNAAVEILGRSMEDILRQKCFQSYHGTNGPPMACPSCATLKTGVATISEVYEPHLRKHIEVKALPRFDNERNLSGLVHVVTDITARKKAEEKQQKLQAQLNQIQKMESIGRLAGGIAHDFNNLLSVIIGYCELTLKEVDRDTKFFHDISSIREAGEKAATLTGQLLAFSRKQVLNMRPVDLNKVVEDMTRMLRRVISEDISLELHLSQRIGRVVADAGQIEQVLLNLAVNARDAMPGGGHFIIETSMVDIDKEYVDHHAEAQLGPHVLLAVTDTGTGISDDVRGQIFDPFFTTKETGKGTGLGLATVYGIIKQHGGQIYVYSESGKGTTFKIYLPTTPHAAVAESDSSSANLPAGSETILIAEDDHSIRNMVMMFLEPMGYRVMAACDGEEAIRLSNAHEGVIDVLLTDVIMPNINGQELADQLKQSRPDMAVIFMSGYTDDVIAHHGVLEAGGNFIQKPITMSKLAYKLRDVLRK